MKYIKFYENFKDFDNILVDKLRKLRKYVQVLKKEKEDKKMLLILLKSFLLYYIII